MPRTRYSPVIHWFQKTQAYSLWWTAMTAWCKGEGGVCEAAVSWAVRWGACCVCQQTVPSKRHRQGSSQARERSYPILQNLEHSAHLTHQPRCAPWIAELAVQSVTTLEMNKSQFFLPKSTLFFLPSAFRSFGKQMFSSVPELSSRFVIVCLAPCPVPGIDLMQSCWYSYAIVSYEIILLLLLLG